MVMDMFVALSDPTRRAILEVLAGSGELSATDIYEQFSVSPQAISQHLKVLREANLVVMEKHAQKHLYRLLEALPGGRTKLTAHSVFQSVADRDGALQSGMEEGV